MSSLIVDSEKAMRQEISETNNELRTEVNVQLGATDKTIEMQKKKMEDKIDREIKSVGEIVRTVESGLKSNVEAQMGKIETGLGNKIKEVDGKVDNLDKRTSDLSNKIVEANKTAADINELMTKW